MKLKPEVKLTRLSSQALLAMLVAERVYKSLQLDFVVTSVNDGKHMPGSKHYQGDAFDCRTRHLNAEQQNLVVSDIRAKLPPSQFDVVLESDHIHIEFDPK